MPIAFYPSLIELNIRVRLNEVGPRAALDDLPDALLDRLARPGLRLGLAARRLADRAGWLAVLSENEEWRGAYAEALPGFTEDDVCGSPFAVHSYSVHEDFGGTWSWPGRERFRGHGLNRSST